jgi:hypothetical protein
LLKLLLVLIIAQILDKLIPPAVDSISAQNAQLVINRSVALAMANDTNALDDLRKNFEVAMKQTPQFDLFKILTQPEAGLPKDTNTMQAFMADVDLFRDYLENYRTIK